MIKGRNLISYHRDGFDGLRLKKSEVCGITVKLLEMTPCLFIFYFLGEKNRSFILQLTWPLKWQLVKAHQFGTNCLTNQQRNNVTIFE